MGKRSRFGADVQCREDLGVALLADLVQRAAELRERPGR
jgi:hypothetical protein